MHIRFTDPSSNRSEISILLGPYQSIDVVRCGMYCVSEYDGSIHFVAEIVNGFWEVSDDVLKLIQRRTWPSFHIVTT